MADSVKPDIGEGDANLKGSHPSVEEAKDAGHFHIDGAEFLHVILNGPDGKLSQRDSDLAVKDLEIHESHGEGILDEEALETGYALLHLVVPIVAAGINPSSAAALIAFTILIDNDMHKDMDYDHLNDLKVAGKTFHEHAVDLVVAIEDGEYKEFMSGAIEHSLHRHFEHTKKRKDIANWKVPEGIDDFLKWRNYEGSFYTVVLVFLTAGGVVDVRKITPKAIEDTLIGAILNFDIHAHYRHSTEREVGDALLHLKGKFSDRVKQALKIVRKSYDDIVAQDISDRAKEILTRYILGMGEINYLSQRYWKYSSVHAGVSCDDNKLWSHTHLAEADDAAFNMNHTDLKYHHE